MKFSEKLLKKEQDFFVGRLDELKLMHKHASGRWKWHWLHIYGQGGIGKSTLIKQFRRELKGSLYYYLDGSRIIKHKKDILMQLAEQLWDKDHYEPGKQNEDKVIKEINLRSQYLDDNIVLLIDTFENLRSEEDWLLDWLGNLKAAVKIITAGRHPLTGGWLRSGWASFVYSMALPALTAREVKQYASIRGIKNRNAQTHLFEFSRGIPLAMALSAEMILRKEDYKPIKREEQVQLIEGLMEDLLHGLPPSVCRLFEAAAVYWRFNEERLSGILQEEIETESFRKLIRMPFVILREDGWSLHDAARAWALDDLLMRKPQTYEQYRKRAINHIRLEEQNNPHLREKLHLDKMILHESRLVRDICFSGHSHIDDIELRQCRECDLEALQSLYLRYYHYVCPSVPEEKHMEHILRPIWETDPSSFITLWKEDKLIAFYGKVPLHDRMLKVLINEPLLQPFIKGWKPIPNAYLLSLVGVEPAIEDKMRTFIVNTIINHLSLTEWIFDFTCLKEWFPVLELCGFERLPWTDATTRFGTEYRGYALDLTKEDYLTKLDRLLTTTRTQEKNIIQASSASSIQELKSLLKEYANLPFKQELAEAFVRLFPQRINMYESNKLTGHDIQQVITMVINCLIEKGNQDAILGKLLKYTYLQGIKPQERVAERLNLSTASYYRYLTKALNQLHHILSDEKILLKNRAPKKD